MERNVLAAVALSILVLVLYQAFLAPPPEPPKPTSAPPSSASNQAAPPPAQSAPPKAGVLPEAPAAAPDSAPGRDIVVENAAVRAVFTTTGGALKSWRLKRYHNESGQPLELVPEHVPPGTVRPFTLATDDQAASALLATATYTTDETGDGAHGFPQTLRFGYKDGNGLTAQKTFAFVADEPYVIGVTASVSQDGQPRPVVIEWGPALGNGVVQHSRSYNPPPQPIFFKDRKVTRVTAAKISQQAVQQGTFGFAGVDDHYFLSAIVEPKQPLKIEYRAIDMPVEGVADGAHFAAWSARFDSSPQEATYFLGPKDFDVLARVDRDLVRAIDFGIFSWLVVPLLRALKWVNGYVGNYGWSLVILTVLINLAMFPLRHKSVVSMRKMQEIQPEVKAIQDRYAKLKMSDPARSK
ncbi:MAG TPA: membrane protein insertase YidC, partial [Gemmatimonadales bacterium]